jgi:hypothetical protein
MRSRGALSLPPQELCDELVNAFFTWVAPTVPIINQQSFMKRYRDPKKPPSILLMQTLLLAGSRIFTTEVWMSWNGSSIPHATLFYQRAKALYDADYENNRVTIVQALILTGWHCEDPGKVTKNVFYWTGLAVSIAHGLGMHQSARDSNLSLTYKIMEADLVDAVHTGPLGGSCTREANAYRPRGFGRRNGQRGRLYR